MECKLCKSTTFLFITFKENEYYKCNNCSSVMLHPKHYLSSVQEKARYEAHNNDPEDLRYQKFVSPIVQSIMTDFSTKAKGLDFGSGTGPVITKLLTDLGYKLELYDPFFFNNILNINLKYNFIACCEVIEHFNNPYDSFKLLRSLLEIKGILYCKTEIYSESIDFNDWYYKNDPTHVFFYHKDAFHWIQKKLNFTTLEIEDRLIKFRS